MDQLQSWGVMGKEDNPLFLFHMKKDAIRASETLFLQLGLCQENTFQYKPTADNSNVSQAIRRMVSVNNVIDVRFTANWRRPLCGDVEGQDSAVRKLPRQEVSWSVTFSCTVFILSRSKLTYVTRFWQYLRKSKLKQDINTWIKFKCVSNWCHQGSHSGPAGKLRNQFNNAIISACGTPDSWSILQPHSEFPDPVICLRSSMSWDVASRHRVAGSRRFESTKWSHRHESKCPMTLITNRQWHGALSRRTKTLTAPLRKPRNSQSAILLYQAQNNVQT